MYDMLTGPFNGSQWAGQQYAPLVYHQDWSRAAFPVGPSVQPVTCFDYASNQNNPIALAAIGAAPIQSNHFDTSLVNANRTTEDCVLSHLGLQIEMSMRGSPAQANDVALITEANYRVVLHRVGFKFFWKSTTLMECDGHIDDFPAGKGQDHFSQRANEFQCNNGAPVWSNLRPLRRPLACQKGQTHIGGLYEMDPRGGVTLVATVVSIMASIYGIQTGEIT